ncbi:MAG TPA: kelch repeat-containing protein [Phycisphaerales bacterium]|nr:kelch repeat-containing protein [Phycisphaerales bacterium]
MHVVALNRPGHLLAGLLSLVAGTVATAQPTFETLPVNQPSAVNILGTVVTRSGQRVQLSGSVTSFPAMLTDISDNDLVMISPGAGKWLAGTWTQLLGYPFNPCGGNPICDIFSETQPEKCDSLGANVLGLTLSPQTSCQWNVTSWNARGTLVGFFWGSDIRCEGSTPKAISGDGKAVAGVYSGSRLNTQTAWTKRISGQTLVSRSSGFAYFAGMNARGDRMAVTTASPVSGILINGVVDANSVILSIPNQLTINGMSENERWITGYRYTPQLEKIAWVRGPDGEIVDLSVYLAQRGITAASGWTLNEVNDIARDASYIVGSGRDPSGTPRAWRVGLCAHPHRFAQTTDASLTPRWQQALTWNGQVATFIGFGGRDATGAFNNNTVRWNGSAWQTLALATAPAARADHAMATDMTGNSYLFGGQTQAGVTLNDCWKFDGATWSQITSVTPPPATGGHAMSLDIARDRIVMFGGFTNTSGTFAYSGDTYDFDSATNTWTLRQTSGPAPRFAHAMAYDPIRRLTVLFGGYNSDSQHLGDTWVWSGQGSWVQLVGPGPSARYYSSLQWDPSRQGLLLTGGRDASGVLADQWVLTAAGWQQLSEPFPGGAVWTHAAATAPMGDMIIAGGSAADFVVKDDTFVSTRDPLITQQPQPQVTYAGQTAIFTVAATGGSIDYRWERNGVSMSDDARISGTTTPTLTITNVQPGDMGLYRVRVMNCASVIRSSEASLDVAACDSIDFNNNGVFPEDQDVVDFFTVLAGGSCATCSDIDFNNNQVFPEDQDVIDFFNVLAGGTCP